MQNQFMQVQIQTVDFDNIIHRAQPGQLAFSQLSRGEYAPVT
jgi:hypothetical protein